MQLAQLKNGGFLRFLRCEGFRIVLPCFLARQLRQLCASSAGQLAQIA
jgi:hypothetical protein